MNLKRLEVTFHLRSGAKRICLCDQINVNHDGAGNLTGYDMTGFKNGSTDPALYMRMDSVDLITIRDIFRFF